MVDGECEFTRSIDTAHVELNKCGVGVRRADLDVVGLRLPVHPRGNTKLAISAPIVNAQYTAWDDVPLYQCLPPVWKSPPHMGRNLRGIDLIGPWNEILREPGRDSRDDARKEWKLVSLKRAEARALEVKSPPHGVLACNASPVCGDMAGSSD
eukprot:scaffold35699_cov31-Tisochrysis_lutea.AAC.3